MKKLVVVAVVVGMAVGTVAWAEGADRQEILSTGGEVSALIAAPVTNEPFSAKQVTERTRVLADGTTLHRRGSHFVARDSQGRVRLEQKMQSAQDGKPELKMVYVKDPVAHTLTTWMEGAPNGSKVASVAKLPENEKVPTTCAGCSQNTISTENPVESATDLGASIVDEVPVKGTLYTIEISQKNSGADRPISKTHEMWISDEMKLVMKQKWEDPRNGEKVVELRDFSRAEPAAELFRVPAGYRVQSQAEGLKQLLAKLEAAQE